MTNCTSFNTFEAKLDTKLTVEKISAAVFPAQHLKHLKFNGVNSLLNESFNLTAEELQFSFYQVVRNDQSELYFSQKDSDYTSVCFNEKQTDAILFIVFEKRLGVIESNSNRLFCQLFLAQDLNACPNLSPGAQKHVEEVAKVFKEQYA